MSRQVITIATIAVAMVALSVLFPATVQAASSSPSGIQVELAGSLHFAFKTQTCGTQNPNCAPTSMEVTYMTALDGSNYVLIGVHTSYLENTKVVVTGWLQATSESSSGGLTPALTFAGTIDVMSLQAHCERHLG